MKRTISVVLITLLVAPPASAEQNEPVEWQEVKGLQPGTEVMLTVRGGHPTKVRLLFADDVTLVTLKPSAPKLPKDFLVGLARYWHDIVDRRATFKWGNLHVSQDGLFDGDKKVGDLAELFQQTARSDVWNVFQPPRGWWSKHWKWVVIPVASFFLILWAIAGFYGSFS